MRANIGKTLSMLLAAITHLWLSDRYLDDGTLPTWAMFFVYPREIGWGAELLKGKRVKVEVTLEEWKN